MDRKRGVELTVVIFLLVGLVLFGVFILFNKEIIGFSIVEFVNEEVLTNENIGIDIDVSLSENTFLEEINETLIEINQSVEELNTTEEILLEVNFTENESVSFVINETNFLNEAEELNLTVENITAIENLTNVTLVNVTIEENVTNKTFRILEERPISRVIIKQSVRWVKIVVTNESVTKVELPENAVNISVLKIVDGVKEEVEDEKVLVEEKPLVEFNEITGAVIGLDIGEGFFASLFRLFREITGFAIVEFVNEGVVQQEVNKNQDNVTEVIINESAPTLEIQYNLPGPNVIEEEASGRKRITIFSDVHYENILAYMDIQEVPKGNVVLYWINNNSRILVSDAVYSDLNNNSLTDRIEWIVPSLSNQTYEAEITILNVQSYPTVGGEWLVRFNTTGIANLTISASNGTTYGNETPNDLKFLNLTCGNEQVDYGFNGTHVFKENYFCNETGYHTVQVLTSGKHTQQFVFGNDVEYANNVASASCSTTGHIGIEINASCANVSWYDAASTQFGEFAIINVGDFNNDNTDDILLGSRNNDFGGSAGNNWGRVFIVYGPSNATLNTNITNSYNLSWYGENQTDNLGWSAAFGYINNDSRVDLVLGIFDGGGVKGKIYLIYGGAGYSGDINVSTANASWIPEGTSNNLADGIISVGDINNDSFDDIIVGDSGAKLNGVSTGKVYLIYGGAGYGTNINISTANASWYGEGGSDNFGIYHSVGDVNKDGFNDTVVSANLRTETLSQRGKIYLIYGGAGYGTNINISTANASWFGDSTTDRLGQTVSLFDFNKDGFVDVFAASHLDDIGGTNAGTVYLIYGGAAYSGSNNINTSNASWYGESNSDNLGADGLYGGFDFNNDTYKDFLISSDVNDEFGTDTGKVYLIYGGASYGTNQNISNTSNASWYGEAGSNKLGIRVGSAGDFNNDSVDDILISVSTSNEFGSISGKVYLFYGNATGVASTDTQAPYFSNSTNNTGVKRYFNASMNVTINDTTDITNYTFSWNESGSFTNDTTVQLAGTQTTWFVNISKNVTNAVYNQIVQWRVYACDSSNNCNTSATENLTIANTVPTASTLVLNSTDGTNRTNQNITVYISGSTDNDNHRITNVTDWRLNGTSIALLNMPFDTNYSNHSTNYVIRDYSTFQNNGSLPSNASQVVSFNNTGFEEGSGVDAANWTESGDADRVSDKAYLGSFSMKFVTPTSAQATTQSTVTVVPNVSYVLSGFIYNNLSANTNAYIDLNDISEECSASSTRGYNNWQFVTCIFLAGPSRTSVTVRLVVDGSGIGTNIGNAWFDGIAINSYIPIWNSTGYRGGAYLFNGLGGYIEVPDSNSLTPGTKATFMAWIKPDNDDSNLNFSVIFDKWNQTTEDEYEFGLLKNGSLDFAWHTTGGNTYGNSSSSDSQSPYNDLASNTTIQFGNWSHVVVVRNGTSLNFYINGNPAGTYSNAIDNNPFRNGGAPFVVGTQTRSSTASDYTFNGTIDEVIVYNRSLSHEQIKAIYNNFTNRVVSEELYFNQNWSACVTPNDAVGDGATTCTGNLTVNTPPESLNQSYIIQGNYNDTLRSFFNSSWHDIDQSNSTLTVFLESNYTGIATNYTANHITGGIYNYSAVFPAGTITRRWCANDSTSAMNCTNLETFTISKGTANIKLLLDSTRSNLTITEGSSINITSVLIDGQGDIETYNNSVLIANGSSPIKNESIKFNTAGSYNITAFLPERQNFTSDPETWFVIVNAVPAPEGGGGGGAPEPPAEEPPVEEPEEEPEPPAEIPPVEQPPITPGETPIEPESGVEITEETPLITSLILTDNGLIVGIGNNTNITLTFEEIFEDGRLKKKPKINVDFSFGEECKDCLHEEKPFIVWPWLLIVAWILAALLLLFLYKERRKEVKIKKKIKLPTVIKLPSVFDSSAYRFFRYHLILFIKEIKDLFDFGDKLLKGKTSKLHIISKAGEISDKVDILEEKLKEGNYIFVIDKLADLRIELLNLYNIERRKRPELDQKLLKLENGSRIGLWVDNSINLLRRNKLNKVKYFLDRINKLGFIPEGAIEVKYDKVLNSYEYRILKNTYASFRNKLKEALKERKLNSAIRYYKSYLAILHKLYLKENSLERSVLHKEADYYHNLINVFILENRARVQIREAELKEIHIERPRKYEAVYKIDPLFKKFTGKLDVINNLIKENRLKEAEKHYHDLVEIYNDEVGYLSKDVALPIYSDILKIANELRSREIINHIKHVEKVKQQKAEFEKVRVENNIPKDLIEKIELQSKVKKELHNLSYLAEFANKEVSKIKATKSDEEKVKSEHKEIDPVIKDFNKKINLIYSLIKEDNLETAKKEFIELVEFYNTFYDIEGSKIQEQMFIELVKLREETDSKFTVKKLRGLNGN
ncbi:MAG: hypothetical protein HYS32_01470 [Candidatus Woesearchaeota archaeon]|nr:MAG: hypothetical protein HYS32_01470 [Candidatus Woesearchaeota archaeon]